MYCLHVPNELSINIEGKDIITMTQTVLQYGTAPLGKYELQIYQDKVIVSFNYLYPVDKTPIRIHRERLFTLKNPKFISNMDNQTKQHIINKIKICCKLLNTATTKYFHAKMKADAAKKLNEMAEKIQRRAKMARTAE